MTLCSRVEWRAKATILSFMLHLKIFHPFKLLYCLYCLSLSVIIDHLSAWSCKFLSDSGCFRHRRPDPENFSYCLLEAYCDCDIGAIRAKCPKLSVSSTLCYQDARLSPSWGNNSALLPWATIATVNYIKVRVEMISNPVSQTLNVSVGDSTKLTKFLISSPQSLAFPHITLHTA